jgi:hypothetical protein
MPSCDLFFGFKKRLSVFAKAPLFIVFALCGRSQAQWDQAAMSASTLFCIQRYYIYKTQIHRWIHCWRIMNFWSSTTNTKKYYRAVSNVNATVRMKRVKKEREFSTSDLLKVVKGVVIGRERISASVCFAISPFAASLCIKNRRMKSSLRGMCNHATLHKDCGGSNSC